MADPGPPVLFEIVLAPPGDSNVDVAPQLQRAIDRCAAGGGGRVVVPPGTFVCGKVRLRSRVELHLAAGAVLLCAGNFDAILPAGAPYSHGSASAFLWAEDAEDISITGLGAIDGNGRAYVSERLPHIYVMADRRPISVFLAGCRRVTMTGITIRDGAHWTVWLAGCDDVLLHGVRIHNDLRLPNNDGIDIDRCRNVRVSDCHIEAGDDAIVLKTMRGFERYGGTENVLVRGCTLKTTSSAFCIGCEIAAPVRNVSVEGCAISSSHRGLAINHSFEADIEGIRFSNISVETRLFHDRWWGRGEPIYVKSSPWTESDRVGRIRDVRFEHIRARSENGVLVRGQTADRIDGIELDDVEIRLERWSRWPGGRLDLRPCPGEADGYGSGVVDHPTYGFLLKNARNVALRRCKVTAAEPSSGSFAGPLLAEGIEGLELDAFRSAGFSGQR